MNLQPWQITKQSYESILKQLLDIPALSQEGKEFGDCLIVNILLCQQVEDLPNEQLKANLWANISENLTSTLESCETFAKKFQTEGR